MNPQNHKDTEDTLLKKCLLNQAGRAVDAEFETRLLNRLLAYSKELHQPEYSVGAVLVMYMNRYRFQLVALLGLLVIVFFIFWQQQSMQLFNGDDLFGVDTLSMISLYAM